MHGVAGFDRSRSESIAERLAGDPRRLELDVAAVVGTEADHALLPSAHLELAEGAAGADVDLHAGPLAVARGVAPRRDLTRTIIMRDASALSKLNSWRLPKSIKIK